MKIGELATLTGLSASRIRFYESTGLLTRVSRRANGYRDYPIEAAWMLEIISSAQRAGFTLEQIRQLLPMQHGGGDPAQLLSALRARVADVEALQARLKETHAQLLLAIDSIERRPTDVSCSESTAEVLQQLRESGVVALRPV